MTVTLKNKPPVVVPPAALRRAGFKRGQDLQFKASGGIIRILPKLPSADDEYTPAQRRAIDARLAEARKGPYYGPFATADEAINFLQKEIKRRRSTKRKTT